jgi:hypothetical protein
MSKDSKQVETKEDGEVTKAVVISPEDCLNVKKYCEHFGVPSTPELDQALDAFIATPTYENQVEVKLQLCKWILKGDHPSFKDQLWEAPIKVSEDVVFELQFDKDVKNELLSDDKDNQ